MHDQLNVHHMLRALQSSALHSTCVRVSGSVFCCVQAMASVDSIPSRPSQSEAAPTRRVAMAYSEEMLLHFDSTGKRDHPESPQRLIRIVKQLQEANLTSQCLNLEVTRADDAELLTCHTQAHLDNMTRLSAEAASRSSDGSPHTIHPRSYNSIYMNPHSADCARVSAGACIGVATAVVRYKPS